MGNFLTLSAWVGYIRGYIRGYISIPDVLNNLYGKLSSKIQRFKLLTNYWGWCSVEVKYHENLE